MPDEEQKPARPNARTRLLDVAMVVIRRKGFAATSIDDLCRAAGVTKGAFFHHFASKQELGVAAADHWSETTSALFADAPYHRHADPRDRVLGYLDFRRSLIAGETSAFTCLVGTMVQETHESSPAIRDACRNSIFDHSKVVEADIAAAMEVTGTVPGWTASSLALHFQAVLQGAFVLAKAGNDPEVALQSLDHLRRYVALLFDRSPGKGTEE
ncbi:MAG: TetR/AcrR family transcriptional regulator [Minwuia sp.]|nr:TetR/AcrR family transcriptional regulator [Minwuia sp.]